MKHMSWLANLAKKLEGHTATAKRAYRQLACAGTWPYDKPCRGALVPKATGLCGHTATGKKNNLAGMLWCPKKSWELSCELVKRPWPRGPRAVPNLVLAASLVVAGLQLAVALVAQAELAGELLETFSTEGPRLALGEQVRKANCVRGLTLAGSWPAASPRSRFDASTGCGTVRRRMDGAM